MSRYKKFVFSTAIEAEARCYTSTLATKTPSAPASSTTVATVARSSDSKRSEDVGGEVQNKTETALQTEKAVPSDIVITSVFKGFSTNKQKISLQDRDAWYQEWGWVQLMELDDLPPVPFFLNNAATVVDKEKFLNKLQADLIKGPSGARARTGVLQIDCANLKNLYEEYRGILCQKIRDRE